MKGKKTAPARSPGRARAKARGAREAPPRRLFLVDDHPVFRQGLAQIVNAEKGLTVCGEAGTAEAALRMIAAREPDLALVDISLPGKSGLQLIAELRRAHSRLRLLVVSMHDEAFYADRALRAGADGYIMKGEDPEEMVRAMHDVLRGHIYLSEEVLAKQAPAKRGKAAASGSRLLSRLTDEELEIMELLVRGQSPREIDRQLALGARAIGAAIARIQKKLKLKSVTALRHTLSG